MLEGPREPVLIVSCEFLSYPLSNLTRYTATVVKWPQLQDMAVYPSDGLQFIFTGCHDFIVSYVKRYWHHGRICLMSPNCTRHSPKTDIHGHVFRPYNSLEIASLVPWAARTSPSKDSTAHSDSHSHLELLDFNWAKHTQIRSTWFTWLQRHPCSRDKWNVWLACYKRSKNLLKSNARWNTYGSHRLWHERYSKVVPTIKCTCSVFIDNFKNISTSALK